MSTDSTREIRGNAKGETMKRVLTVLFFILLFGGCQWGTRTFGGTTEIKLPPYEKLVTATWRGSDLWYLTRPMRPNDNSEILIFRESSALGIAEGKVIFYESRQ